MSPQTYQEWAEALLSAGASVEIDAKKIDREDAERLAALAAMSKSAPTLTLYNCESIPFDLRPCASLGKGRVHFRM